MLIKDISRFKNRDLKKSILIDPKPLNFLLTPENGLPCIEYNAELDFAGFNEDPYLLTLREELKKLVKMDDVRPYLE